MATKNVTETKYIVDHRPSEEIFKEKESKIKNISIDFEAVLAFVSLVATALIVLLV